LEQVFPRNLIHYPQHVLDGMLVLKCEFCETSQTPIESDMRIHLREEYVDELVKDLPLTGKGFMALLLRFYFSEANFAVL
jgi:hypothetical protein